MPPERCVSLGIGDLSPKSAQRIQAPCLRTPWHGPLPVVHVHAVAADPEKEEHIRVRVKILDVRLKAPLLPLRRETGSFGWQRTWAPRREVIVRIGVVELHGRDNPPAPQL